MLQWYASVSQTHKAKAAVVRFCSVCYLVSYILPTAEAGAQRWDLKGVLCVLQPFLCVCALLQLHPAMLCLHCLRGLNSLFCLCIQTHLMVMAY